MTTQTQDRIERFGVVTLVGKPNVGKSTLLNALLDQKISITSRKPQTTRHRITGVLTEPPVQVAFLDTPGLHRDEPSAMNQLMNRAALSALQGVDLVLFVIERLQWTDDDAWVLAGLQRAGVRVALVINKVDQVAEKNRLLPFIEARSANGDFVEIFPISALKGLQTGELKTWLVSQMPEGPHHFSEDQVTDRPMRFMAAEVIREKIMRQLGDELPYATAVEIESFEMQNDTAHIHALILVERSGQKRIVIGKSGEKLRRIGTDARKELEHMMGGKVMLHLWVKVRSGWSDDMRALRSLGYTDE